MKLIVVTVIALTLSIWRSSAGLDFPRSTYNTFVVNYIKITEVNEAVCNVTFTMKRIRGKLGEFTFDLNLFVPIYYAKASMTLLIRRSANVFQPTVITNIGFEICGIVKNNATLLMKTRFLALIYPKMYEALSDHIHPCPYGPGRIRIQHTVDAVFVNNMMEPSDYKVIVRLADRQNGTLGMGFGMITIKQGYPPSKRRT